MVKLKEVVEKYQDYEVDEEKLKEILIKPKPKSVWELDSGDEYYAVVFAKDRFCVRICKWYDIPYDKELRDTGNIFLTEEEAEFELERRKIETILLKYGRRNFKYNKSNYAIVYHRRLHSIGFDCSFYTQYQGIIYFDTKELLEKAIEEAGEENIKKYIFGVDEDD